MAAFYCFRDTCAGILIEKEIELFIEPREFSDKALAKFFYYAADEIYHRLGTSSRWSLEFLLRKMYT